MRATVLVCLASLLTPTLALAVDVTSCGQVVPARETGVLQNDLSACGSSVTGVFLEDRATLDLNGHVIAGGFTGVQCLDRRCTVHGPGEIRGHGFYGINSTGRNGRLTVRDLDVHDNVLGGIVASAGNPRITVERVTATRNRVGIEAASRGRISGTDVDASENRDWGIVAGTRFRFERLTVLDTGVSDPHPEDHGVVSNYGSGVLIDSTVTGSVGDDVVTFKRPKVKNTVCGTSRFLHPDGPTWGVCAND